MAREFLMIVQESAFKTAALTPTIWTTSTSYGLGNYQGLYIRLADGNAFTMRSRPVTVETPYGGGVAIPAYRVTDKEEIRGKLRVKLCVGQAPFLLSWAAARISGGTSPWTTTEPNGDLASCSVYHAKQQFGGTYKRTLYSGVKVDGWNLSVSEQSTEAVLDLDLSGALQAGEQFDSTSDPSSGTFPAPADNNFPVDPYVFLHAGGSNFITWNGSTRTQFTELAISCQNTLARRFFANRYIQMLRFMGRRTSVATRNLYTADTDRTNYEAQASETMSIELNNGSHGFVLGFNAQNVIEQYEDDLPLPDLYFQAGTAVNMWDPSAGSDFTLSIA